MVAAQPVLLNVRDTRPPKTVGMTRIKTRPLHPNAKEKGGKAARREPSVEEDICAPPIGSSDEDDGEIQARERSRSPLIKVEEPSYPVTWSQRDDQSRKCEQVEEELPSSFDSQKRRSQKRVNTYSKTQNIHEHISKRRSQGSQSSETSSGRQKDEKRGRSFNVPPINPVKSKSNGIFILLVIWLTLPSTLTSSRAVCLSSTA